MHGDIGALKDFPEERKSHVNKSEVLQCMWRRLVSVPPPGWSGSCSCFPHAYTHNKKKSFFSIHLLGFLLSVAVNVFSTYFSHNCRIAAAILTREVSNLRSHFRQSFWSYEASPGSNATCQETRGRVYYAGKILNILGINCKDTEPDFCTIKCNIKHQKKSVDENYSNSCLWTVTEGHLVDNTRHLRFSEILFGSPAYFA